MGRGKDLSQADFSAIETYIQETSLDCKKIADKVGVSLSSVYRVKRKIESVEYYEPQRVGKCGRKSCTTPRQERILVNLVKKDRSKSSRQLAADLVDYDVQCTPSAVRKKLNKLGYRACSPTRVPRLTEAMSKKRLAWAKAHNHGTSDDWEKGGTLHQSEIQKDSDSDDSDDSVERDLSHKLTDEELFKLCGGRTAHKEARHGLSMSAKLARVQEQVQKLMEKWKSTEQPPHQPCASEMSHSQEKEEKRRKKKKKSKTQMEDSDVTEEVEVPVEEVSLSAGYEGAEGKRKRKKKKSKDKNPSENDCMNETEVCIPEKDTAVTHKSKRKKKKHDKDRNSEKYPPVEDVIIDIQVRKKHKKSKKVQRDPEEQMTLNERENVESVVNESVDRSEEEKKTKEKKKKKSHPEVSEDQELSDSERHNEPKNEEEKER